LNYASDIAQNRLFQFAILCSLVAGAGLFADRFNTDRHLVSLRASLLEMSATLRAQIERELTESIVVSRAMVAGIATNPDLNQVEFAAQAARLKRQNSEIVNIAAAPGLVVKYVYPLERNGAVLGLDYRATEVQLAAVELARVSKRPVLAGPVDLIQGGVGLIVREPVFVANPSTGKDEFWGIVSVVIDWGLFLDRAGVIDQSRILSIAIQGRDGIADSDAMVFGDSNTFRNDPVLQTVELPFGFWRVAVLPLNGWPTRAPNSTTIWAIVFLLGLMAALAWNALFKARVNKERAQRQLLDAIETTDDGFAFYDARDRFVMCNSKYRKFYQKSEHLLVAGHNFSQIIRGGIQAGQYPAAKGREEDWFQERMKAHNQPHSEVIQQIEGGHWLKISERRTPDGGTVGFRVDITELVHAREAAEAANKAKSEFLANINHEMRTPLTVIQGYNTFLLKPQYLPSYAPMMAALEKKRLSRPGLKKAVNNLLSDVSDYAKRAEDASKTLSTLVSNSLDFSNIEAGNMILASDRIKIGGIVSSLVKKYECQAESKNICLNVNVDSVDIRGDETRVRQILDSLIGNAVKFTETGHVTIRAESKEGYMIFEVCDTGIGIEEAHQEKIFQTFQQGDGSNTRKYGGAGLGLALSYKLVQLQGGCMKVNSKTGLGSTFSFTIPVWTHPKTNPAA